MREEARLKGKELQDIHVGFLKIFGGLNRIDIKMEESITDFSYKKCIGKTVYVGTKVINDDSPIRINNVKFISDIKETGLYESFNLVVRLDKTIKQTDEIALNHLLWMNGIESVFRDLLDDEEPTKRIQAIADILVFYHECLGKGRYMEGNSYHIATAKERTSLVVTYIGNYLFDIHLERTIDYSDLGGFEVEHEEVEKKSFFSFLKRDAIAPTEKKSKSLFKNKVEDLDEFDNAVIATPSVEPVDKVKKALDLKHQREREQIEERVIRPQREEIIEEEVVPRKKPYTVESIDQSVLAQVKRVQERRKQKELEFEIELDKDIEIIDDIEETDINLKDYFL